ncbi:hypothetical protein KSD_82700 [Ktedonobacter sp. SOSP1-85]|uniref:sugar-binding protein n=1 Tax=Ktedonobacter sp. SOSP1-85 TaxID=2778367 RepID=UPI0019162404|nr:sugar-binding protein [Ktedonobacter sp. SOSP1-85]GHO80499.1 hypothetical protein KSD_82700 [Ktedonobacter sp. SOSP1-85]
MAQQQGQQSIQVAYAPYKTVTIDGDLSDWEDIIPVSITGKATDGTTRTYKARMAWDDNYFYFAAEIADDVQVSNLPFEQNPYAFPFNVDSIQLVFDTLDKKAEDLLAGDAHYEKACATSVDHLYVATLASNNVPELHRQAAPGTNYQTFYPTNAPLNPPLGPLNTGTTGTQEGQINVVRDNTKLLTTYEIAIAWSQLPELQARLQKLEQRNVLDVHFAFSVEDAGKAPAVGRSYWTNEAGILESGAYSFAPFWGTGLKSTGSRVITRWGFTR